MSEKCVSRISYNEYFLFLSFHITAKCDKKHINLNSLQTYIQCWMKLFWFNSSWVYNQYTSCNYVKQQTVNDVQFSLLLLVSEWFSTWNTQKTIRNFLLKCINISHNGQQIFASFTSRGNCSNSRWNRM